MPEPLSREEFAVLVKRAGLDLTHANIDDLYSAWPHIERFTADRPTAAQEAQMQALTREAEGLTMLVTLDGRKRRVGFDAAAGNILDSARIAGLPAPYACKAGVCATCRARVVSGEVEMAARYGLSDEEIAAGYVLTCQSVPKGEGVEVDYDA